MKILIVQTSSRQIQYTTNLLKKKLEKDHQNSFQDISLNRSPNIAVEIWDSTKPQITCADIKRSKADLFINFNLNGFEQSTLTDGIAYNLLDCKQLHILLKSRLPEERYLAKQLSISMFFYCVDPEYCEYLQDKYPDIPYLKTIEGWKKEGEENSASKNADILFSIVREIAKFCRMVP